MINLKTAVLAIAAASLLAYAQNAKAQLGFKLSPSSSITQRGNQVTLVGTLTNATLESFDLTSTAGSITGGAGTDLSLDENDFVSSLPTTFLPGDVYSGNLYIDVAPDAALTDYTVIYSILGVHDTSGADFSVTSTARVTVNSTVPAPSSLLALGCGLGGTLLQVSRLRKRNCL